MEVKDSKGLQELYKTGWVSDVAPVMIFDSVMQKDHGPQLTVEMGVNMRDEKKKAIEQITNKDKGDVKKPLKKNPKLIFDTVISELKRKSKPSELKHFILNMTAHLFGVESIAKVRAINMLLDDTRTSTCSILSPESKAVTIYYLSQGVCDLKVINGNQAMSQIYRSKSPYPMADIDARLKSWVSHPKSLQELDKWKENKIDVDEHKMEQGFFFILGPQQSWQHNERCILVCEEQMIALKWVVDL